MEKARIELTALQSEYIVRLLDCDKHENTLSFEDNYLNSVIRKKIEEAEKIKKIPKVLRKIRKKYQR